MPDGKTKDYEIKQEGEVVCVVPITKEGNIVLAKQFRPGPEKLLFELPGGGLEKGESPEEAIKRELLEETGYVGDFKFVQSIFSCGYSNLVRHCFIATDCYKKSEQKLDETEFIEVVEMSLEDFRKHLRSGQLTDIETGYLGLDFLNLL